MNPLERGHADQAREDAFQLLASAARQDPDVAASAHALGARRSAAAAAALAAGYVDTLAHITAELVIAATTVAQAETKRAREATLTASARTRYADARLINRALMELAARNSERAMSRPGRPVRLLRGWEEPTP